MVVIPQVYFATQGHNRKTDTIPIIKHGDSINFGGGAISWHTGLYIDSPFNFWVEIKEDKTLSTDTPYTVKMHNNHAVIIYKHGKKVGAFEYYKKPFELDGLWVQ